MSKEQIVEKVIVYLRNEQRLLEWQLRIREKEYGKVILSLSKLSSVVPSKGLLRSIRERFFLWKAKRVKKEIIDLERKRSRYTLAIFDLRRGFYKAAIILLEELSDRFIDPLPSLVPSIDGIKLNPLPNRTFFLLVNLRKNLISFEEERKKGTALH